MRTFIDTEPNSNYTSEEHLHSSNKNASSSQSLISNPCCIENNHFDALQTEITGNCKEQQKISMIDSTENSFQSPSKNVRKDIYDFDEGDEFVFGSLATKPSTPQRLAITSWTEDQRECLEAAKQIIKSNVYSSIIIRTYPPKRKQQESTTDVEADPATVDSETSLVVKKRKSSWTEEDETWFRGKIDELLQARSISPVQMKEILETPDAKMRLFGFLESASLCLHRSENSLLSYMRAIFEVTGYERLPIQDIALKTADSSIPFFNCGDAEYIHGCILSFCENEGITLDEFGHRICDPNIRYTGQQSLYNEILLNIQKDVDKKSLLNYIKLVYRPKSEHETWSEETFQKLYHLVSQEGTRWNWIATQLGLPSEECALLWRFVAKPSKRSSTKPLTSSPKSSSTNSFEKSTDTESQVGFKFHSLNDNKNLAKTQTAEVLPEVNAEDMKEEPSVTKPKHDENDKQGKKKSYKKKKRKNASRFYAGDSLQLLEHVNNRVPADAKITADLDWNQISNVMSKWTSEELKLQTDNLISTVKGWKKKPLHYNIKAAIDELKTLPQGTLKQTNRKI